jgi:hypothetical protein
MYTARNFHLEQVYLNGTICSKKVSKYKNTKIGSEKPFTAFFMLKVYDIKNLFWRKRL